MGQRGGLAQLVEHRTENPCVPGSSPGSTTMIDFKSLSCEQERLFCFAPFQFGRILKVIRQH